MARNEGSGKNVVTKHRKPKLLEHWHLISIWLIIYDIIVANGAYFLALWVRFDCHFSEIPSDYFNAWLSFTPIYADRKSVV